MNGTVQAPPNDPEGTTSEENLAKSVLDCLDGIGKVMQRSGKKFKK